MKEHMIMTVKELSEFLKLLDPNAIVAYKDSKEGITQLPFSIQFVYVDDWQKDAIIFTERKS